MDKIKETISTILLFITISIPFIVFISIIYIYCIMPYTNNQEIVITVKDKYIKAEYSNNNSQQRYLVVDTDNNTYEVTDLFFRGKFNSTDLYNLLEKGNKYKIEISGNRLHFLSRYPNINKVSLLEE